MVAKYMAKQLEAGESAGAILQDSVMNVRTVQSCNAQATMVERCDLLTVCH
jgi:hypothetical protein